MAVPTPGAIGGFHEAFRLGATCFYGVPNDAAVAAALVLHASLGPACCLGLLFAAQVGLNIAGMRQMADGEPGSGQRHEVSRTAGTSATKWSTHAKAGKAK